MVRFWDETSDEFSGSFDPCAQDVKDTCSRLRYSANNSRDTDPDFLTNEMVLIAAILCAKFVLWFLYRAARSVDIDVSNL